MKRLALAALPLLTTLVFVLSAHASDKPREVVRKLTDEVIAVLQQKETPPEEKREQVRGIVLDYVDFETMSRLVLARNWRAIGKEKQQEFVEEFKSHLAATYGKNVDSYRDEKVTITGDRAEARGDSTVKTRIVRNGPNDILVDYRLRKLGDEWKIIDVIIERVSLVSNFRSQFQGILSSRGVDGVLEELRRKNETGESGFESS